VRAKAAAGLARVGAACALLLGSTLTLAGAPGMGSRVRAMQPFATICAWLAPAAPPIPPGGLTLIAGGVCAPPPPAPSPAPTAEEEP
jgi:hypothetical protein